MGCLTLLLILSICLLLLWTIPAILRHRAQEAKEAEGDDSEDPALAPLLSDSGVGGTSFKRASLSSTAEQAMPLKEGEMYVPPTRSLSPHPLMITYHAPQDKPTFTFAPDAPSGTLPETIPPSLQGMDAQYPPPLPATNFTSPSVYMETRHTLGPPVTPSTLSTTG